MVINFYSTKGEYGCFSNFSRHPIVLEGEIWPTTEHYYQAKKFEGTPHEEEVRKASSPREAANMGRDRNRPLRLDWENVKDDVMRAAVRAKFTQNIVIRQTLISTKNAILVEHTKNDSYWGDGGDGSGKNMLGKILMEVREELKDENKKYPVKNFWIETAISKRASNGTCSASRIRKPTEFEFLNFISRPCDHTKEELLVYDVPSYIHDMRHCAICGDIVGLI
jgi:ribA/ribD-fused uncharacterized protein